MATRTPIKDFVGHYVALALTLIIVLLSWMAVMFSRSLAVSAVYGEQIIVLNKTDGIHTQELRNHGGQINALEQKVAVTETKLEYLHPKVISTTP